ncbi:MAG: serine/threonine-protein kinase, partial [Deltaproteobacteria bacterium]
MGSVSIARLKGPSGFKRLVAIKTIHAHLSANEEYAQMLHREADLASRLEHPNVIPVIEFGSENGQMYLVMEYYPSVPLSDVMRTLARNQQKMPLGHAVGFAMDAAAGLEAAHNLTNDQDEQCLGIVHRDVTPSNLLVGVDGLVRVTDFGLAKAHATTVDAITSDTKMVKGKLAYLSPEQATCEALDRRSDVFTLGIVLFEMVTGRRLFAGENDLALLRAILDMPIPSPQEARPECPDILAAVIAKALERDAGQRYHSAADFRDALQQVAREISDVGRSTFVERLVGQTFVDRRRAIATAEAERDALARSMPPPPPPPSVEMEELEVSESDI